MSKRASAVDMMAGTVLDGDQLLGVWCEMHVHVFLGSVEVCSDELVEAGRGVHGVLGVPARSMVAGMREEAQKRSRRCTG